MMFNQTLEARRDNTARRHRHVGGLGGSAGELFSLLPYLREADVLATLPMYDPPGCYMLASWYRRRYGSVLCRWDDL